MEKSKDNVVMDSVLIKMDKGTMIVGFDKAIESLLVDISGGVVGWEDLHVYRPSGCKDDYSCVCLCTETKVESDIDGTSANAE